MDPAGDIRRNRILCMIYDGFTQERENQVVLRKEDKGMDNVRPKGITEQEKLKERKSVEAAQEDWALLYDSHVSDTVNE